MTHDKILDYLRDRSDLSDWSFESSAEDSRELFFTGERLDMTRSKSIVRGKLTVHSDGLMGGGEKGRGSAVVSVPRSADLLELSGIVDRALSRASCSLSPGWSLPSSAAAAPRGGHHVRTAAVDLSESLDRLRDAVFSCYGDPACRGAREAGARLAASELFLTSRERRVTTSRGVDFAWSDLLAEAECAAVAHESDGGEIDLVDRWASGVPDPEALAASVRTLLVNAADRARARPMAALRDLPVVLSGEALETFFGHFFHRASAVQVRLGVSDARIGGPLLSGPCAGDALTIGIDPAIPGGTENRPADGDGFPLVRAVLAENGILRALEGPSRYSLWLGVPPVGACSSRWAASGSLEEKDLLGMDRLDALVFSDFYMNEASGDFGGELRLGILHRGKERLPVTGGSISGSVSAERPGFRFSSALKRTGAFLGPAAVVLRGARIAGAE